MKKIALILILLLNTAALNAQSFTVFDVDTTDFPVMKAKFYAFDEDYKQLLDLSPDNFEVYEDGVEREVLSVSCPEPAPPTAISSVLVMDISGSMKGTMLEKAQEAARSWVNALPLGKSECAITSFDTKNNMLQDFTKDRNRLLEKIELLGAGGGTDYEAGLINPLSGGLLVAQTGKYKKVLVFLTDGRPNFTPDVNKIVAEALKYNVTIFAVTLDMPCPKCLRDISSQTGGSYFENVSTIEEARGIYLKMLQASQGGGACEIEWETGIDCNINKTFFVELLPINTTSTIIGFVPENLRAKLVINPYCIRFREVEPEKNKDTTITMYAINSDFNVSDITSSNSCYQVAPKKFILHSGDSINLTLSYKPIDNTFNFTKFEILSEPCTSFFYANSGYSGISSHQQVLKLTHPNGGEIFPVGSDTIVTWDGILPDDEVDIQFSSNNGREWVGLTDTATGLKYDWHNIPDEESDSCLIKAILKVNPLLWSSISTNGYCIEWSPDGSMIALSGAFHILIFDAVNKKILKYIYAQTHDIANLRWNPDGTSILAGTKDLMRIYDVKTGELLTKLKGHSDEISTFEWSPDGSFIASGSLDSTIIIWDPGTGNKLYTYPKHYDEIISLDWNPNGKQIISGSKDTIIRIWEPFTGTDIKQYNQFNINRSHKGLIRWSPDGLLIASGNMAHIDIWEVENGNIINTIDEYYQTFRWSNSSKKIAFGGTDSLLKVWDVKSGAMEYMSKNIKNIYSLSWSPDDQMIAATSYQCSFSIWDANTGASILFKDMHTGSVSEIAWHPTEPMIAACDRNNFMLIWDIPNDSVIKKYWYNLSLGSLFSVGWNPDGSKVANNAGALIDFNSGDEINFVGGKRMRWSPDGTKIAVVRKDFTYHKIYIYNLQSGAIEKSFGDQMHQPFYTISWSPDGSKIVSATTSGSIIVWDVSSGEILESIDGHTEAVPDLKWNPDGTLLATCSNDDTVKIWDTNTWANVATFDDHISDVISLCWSPDGNRLASGSWDHTIKIWDIHAKCLINTLYTGSNVHSLSWSPDGSSIASGQEDWTIKIWDADDITQIYDVSDSVFSIVAPEIVSNDINMGRVALGKTKDSIITDFIRNVGKWESRIDSIYFIENYSSAFSIVSGIPPYTIAGGASHQAEFGFRPPSAGVHEAKIVIISQSDTLIQKITGYCIYPQLAVTCDWIDFGQVNVNEYKDTVKAIIENTGTASIEITKTEITGPDIDQFEIINGGGSFTLNQLEKRELTLRFKPKYLGKTSTNLKFYHNASGSPALTQLYGEGIKNKPDCDSTGFEYPDFTAVDDVILSGSTGKVDDCIRLTYANMNQAGAIWHEKPLPVGNGFITEFSFRMSSGDNVNTDDGSLPGADGLAFVIQNNLNNDLGTNGGGIGYHGIENALAVEFDLFQNGRKQIIDFKDPNGNHAAIQKSVDNKVSALHSSENTIEMNEDIPELKSDGTIYYAKIEYNIEPNVMSVYLDETGVLDDPVIVAGGVKLNDIVNLLQDQKAFVGITSATGNAYQIHDLLDWYFCPFPVDITAVENEISRDEITFNIYPNPASESTTIEINNPEYQYISLCITDIFGREVKSLYSGYKAPGNITFNWNTGCITDGVYFCRLNLGDENFVKAVVVNK